MNQYALITGAAKGIGRSIAAALAQRRYSLLLADIDGITLAQTAYYIKERYAVDVQHIELDLASDDASGRLKHWSRPYHDRLQIVVNNAGYGLNGSFAHIQCREHVDNIYVNVRAVAEISHTFIPILRQQSEQTYLLNVASTTAYQAVPYLNVYAATKAFVLSFTRGLRYELRKTNVSVSCLSPGSTDTDFVNRARMGESVRKTAARVNMSPDAVARIALQGLFRGRSEIVPGWINKLNAFLPRFFPKSVVEKIAGRIYEPKREEQLVSREISLYPQRYA